MMTEKGRQSDIDSTSEWCIEFWKVRKSFGEKHVLRGVDLKVRRGETLVVLGASGSGKSVMLRHITGLLHPDRGDVWVLGKRISGLSELALHPIRKKIGMLFQGGALFDSMNVSENVGFMLSEHTKLSASEIAEKVREKLELVDLPNVGEVMPSSLSGGMKKRVALARAIALDPQIILYDEPTTGLDPVTANTINKLIRGLQNLLSMTSIVVTHDIVSMFRVADRVAFLHEGEFQFVGTPQEAKESGIKSLEQFLAGGTIG